MHPTLTKDEKNGLHGVAGRAHDLLRPFAEKDDLKTIWDPIYLRLGTHEGVAVLLVAIQFEQSAVQRKEEVAQYDHATLEAYRIVDNLMGFFSTALVVLTLCFSISVAILVSMSISFTASIGPLGGNIALFERWERYDEFLYVCHWFESIFLVGSIYNSFRGIMLGFLSYCSIALYMTELEDKLWFLMTDLTKLSDTWGYTFFSLTCLTLSLPFLGARISPVFCLVSPFLVVAVYSFFVEISNMAFIQAQQQLKRAKEIMARLEDPSTVKSMEG